jgi:hypothetical protein
MEAMDLPMDELDLPPLVIDARGVWRYAGRELLEGIRWADLVKVSIRTTDQGPLLEDFFFLLEGQDGRGCTVPAELAQPAGLLTWLQRLAGFDHEAVIQASTSTQDREFPCWQGQPGQGLAAAGEPEPDATPPAETPS